jgi:hypothetical protein
MSDIRFVDQLGDAFERAIAAKQPSRRSLRHLGPTRIFALALLAAALAVTAVAAARVLTSPQQLATQSIGCYSSRDLGDVTVIWSDAAPVRACAQAMRAAGEPVPHLVACAWNRSVAVIPGSTGSACAAAGFDPLPREFTAARAQTARLERDVLALERAAGCVAPKVLASRVDAVLARDGWDGWHTQVRVDPANGPCSTVSSLGGDGRRTLAGSLDAATKTVLVSNAASRATMTLLYAGAGALAPRLEDRSASQCYSLAELRSYVSVRVAAANRAVSFVVNPPGSAADYGSERDAMLQNGCALLIDLRPASNGRDLVGVIRHRG